MTLKQISDTVSSVNVCTYISKGIPIATFQEEKLKICNHIKIKSFKANSETESLEVV